MAGKSIVIISLFFIVNCTNALQVVNNKIKISTGTASGCGDTSRFIVNQLVPTYELYAENLTLEFVPWGRTVMYDNGTFVCQFGVNDCWANRLHRCVLDQLKTNQTAQLQYMICEFTSLPAYLNTSFACLDTVGLREENVTSCMANSGDQLDLAARDAAAEPMRIINFVPSIVLNDVISVDQHNQARQNLTSMVTNAFNSSPLNLPTILFLLSFILSRFL